MLRKAFILLSAVVFLTAAPSRGQDDDPEPGGKGGPELRKLHGKWVAEKRIFGGKELKNSITYEFAGDTFTTSSDGRDNVAKVKLDTKKKPFILEVTRKNPRTQALETTRMGLKLDKDKLYLTLAKGEVSPDEDFSGTKMPVIILTREKAK